MLLFAFTAGTSYWGFRLAWEKRAARQEARQLILQGIDPQELVQFAFHKTSPDYLRLEWKDGREFRLNGQLYDIVFMRESADSVFCTCYPDHRESQVDKRIGQLSKLLFGQQPGQREREQQWVSFLRGLTLPQEPGLVAATFGSVRKFKNRQDCPHEEGFLSELFQPPERKSILPG